MTDKKLEKLINKAYEGNRMMYEAVSTLALEAKKYTDVEIYGTSVNSDGPVLGFDDLDYQGFLVPYVIPPKEFFYRAKKLKKGEKFSVDDLMNMGI